MRTYSATEAAEIAGVSYRRVDYMARTGYLEPSVPAQGSGSRRRYSRADVAKLRLTCKLLALGVDWAELRHDGDPIVTARRIHAALTKIVEAAA